MSSAKSLHPIFDPLALFIYTPPPVKGFARHSVAAADNLKLFARSKVTKDFQPDFVGTNSFFHLVDTKKVPRQPKPHGGKGSHGKTLLARRENFRFALDF